MQKTYKQVWRINGFILNNHFKKGTREIYGLMNKKWKSMVSTKTHKYKKYQFMASYETTTNKNNQNDAVI